MTAPDRHQPVPRRSSARWPYLSVAVLGWVLTSAACGAAAEPSASTDRSPGVETTSPSPSPSPNTEPSATVAVTASSVSTATAATSPVSMPDPSIPAPVTTLTTTPPDTSTTGPAIGVPALDGRSFIGVDVTGATLVSGSEIGISFLADDTFRLTAGCNQMGGDYTIDNGLFVVRSLSQTEMGCRPELMDQDVWVAAFARSSPSMVVDDRQLVLEGAGVRVTLLDEEIVRPDLPLIGTRWSYGGVFNPQWASIVGSLTSASIVFAEDGTFAADAVCHRGAGTFTLTDHTLTVVSLSWEEQPCTASTDATATDHVIAEREFMDLIAGELDVSIDSSSMRLTRPDGHGIMWRAAS